MVKNLNSVTAEKVTGRRAIMSPQLGRGFGGLASGAHFWEGEAGGRDRARILPNVGLLLSGLGLIGFQFVRARSRR